MTWREDAACRDSLNPEAWFAYGREKSPGAWDDARAICRICPSAAPCLAYAIEHDIREGLWGGLTFEERVTVGRLA